MNGRVEVDETYVGGAEKRLPGRQIEQKAIAVVAAEVYEAKGSGRIRLQQAPDVSEDSLVGFIRQIVSPGSLILTDGWKGYKFFGVNSYPHKMIV